MKIAIVGAGIAGLSLCEGLSQSNCQITLIDSVDSLMGSDAPTMLFHPFPGRSLEEHPRLQQATEETLLLLQTWQQDFPTLIRSSRMIRPLLGTNQKRLQKSYETYWKDTQKHWLQFESWKSSSLRSREPAFDQGHDAITYTPAYEVDFQMLRKQLIQLYINKGVTYVQANIQKIKREKGWFLPDITKHFDGVVLATGNKTNYWFPELRITTQGGSLLQTKTNYKPKHLISVNGLHIGSHHNGNLVIGSTRWNELPSDESQKMELQHRAQEQFLHFPTFQNSSVWHGIRCIYPSDRLPLCGELPHCRKLYVITALGSKGLLWGPLTAKHLRNNICYGTSIPNDLSVLRARAEDAWFSPHIIDSIV